MEQNKAIIAAVVLLLAAAFLASFFAARQPEKNDVLATYWGGSAMLVSNCSDRKFIEDSSDYVLLLGPPGGSETRWENSQIVTYTSFKIEKYLKGQPFPTDAITIRTVSGTMGGISQFVEDQVSGFQEGKKVQVYLERYQGNLTFVCGNFGIRQIE